MPPISQANKLHAVTNTLQTEGSYHAIGFSDLVQLLVIKIKRLSFAQVVRRDRVSRARNTDYAVKTCEIFVVIVKIKRLYDYQTWPTHIWKIHVVRKVLWALLSLLCFLGADWTGQDKLANYMVLICLLNLNVSQLAPEVSYGIMKHETHGLKKHRSANFQHTCDMVHRVESGAETSSCDWIPPLVSLHDTFYPQPVILLKARVVVHVQSGALELG